MDWYIEILWKRFIPASKKIRSFDMNTNIFQPDGAPFSLFWLHTAVLFWWLINSKKTNNIWLPYSPYLSPHDYFLCHYLNEKVYGVSVGKNGKLKENITIEIGRILIDMLERVLKNSMSKPWTNNIQWWSHWIEHVFSY